MRLTIERLSFSEPMGSLLVVCDAEGIVRALDFGADDARLLCRLDARYPGAEVEWGSMALPVRRALDAYFEGDLRAIDTVPVATVGTPFQRAVWDALRTIPAGTTTSYGALAAAIGRPTAVRAVGLAVGSNPVSVIVPCHRVIGANQTLTGFGGGLARKQWLLEHEGIALQGGRVRQGGAERAPQLAL